VQNKELGFVLKRFFPFKQKLSIFAQQKGKIDVITSPISVCSKLWPGMLVSFNTKKTNKNIYISENIEILLSPQEDHFLNLAWIHHLLELCYFFIPQEKPQNEIFKHLYSCFLILKLEHIFSNQFETIKKICSLKFMQLAGFYPRNNLEPLLNIYEQLTCMSIDIDDQQKVKFLKTALELITNAQIKEIDNWILNCVQNHPYVNSFKTICIRSEI